MENIEIYKEDELGTFIENQLVNDEEFLDGIKNMEIDMEDEEQWIEYIYKNCFMIVGGLKGIEILSYYEGDKKNKKKFKSIIQILEKMLIRYGDTEELQLVKENLLTPKYKKEMTIMKKNYILNRLISFCLLSLMLVTAGCISYFAYLYTSDAIFEELVNRFVETAMAYGK